MLERRAFLQRASITLMVALIIGLSVRDTRGQSLGNTETKIRGTLKASSKPITDAELIIQHFADEKCAKLLEEKKPTPDKIARMEACSEDLIPIRPDASGSFEFVNLKPGWYALRFLWNIEPKPKPGTIVRVDRFVLVYAGYRDNSGRYDTFVQGRPFHYSGKADVVIHFEYPK